MSRTEIVVDEENGVVQWWDAARKQLPQAPPFVRSVMDEILNNATCTGALVDDEDIGEVKAWCASLPCWTGGPTYAPTPLRFVKVD
jgi:hypothetical protein